MQNISQYNEEWSCGNPLWRIAVVFILLLIFSAVANLSCAQSVTVGEFGDTLHQRYIRVGAYDDYYTLPDAPGDSGQYLMQGANGHWYYASITDATGGGITADSLLNTEWDFNFPQNFFSGITVEADATFVDEIIAEGGVDISDQLKINDSTLTTVTTGDTIATSEWVRAQGYGAGAGGDYLPATESGGVYSVTVATDFIARNYHASAGIDTLIVGEWEVGVDDGYRFPFERGFEGDVLTQSANGQVVWGAPSGGSSSSAYAQLYGTGWTGMSPYFDTVCTFGQSQQVVVKMLTDSMMNGYMSDDSLITVGASGAGVVFISISGCVEHGTVPGTVRFVLTQNGTEVDMISCYTSMDTTATISMNGIISVAENDVLKVVGQTPDDGMGNCIFIRTWNMSILKID